MIPDSGKAPLDVSGVFILLDNNGGPTVLVLDLTVLDATESVEEFL